jgi:hypothetical protein
MAALLTSSTNLRFHPISLSNFLDFAIDIAVLTSSFVLSLGWYVRLSGFSIGEGAVNRAGRHVGAMACGAVVRFTYYWNTVVARLLLMDRLYCRIAF